MTDLRPPSRRNSLIVLAILLICVVPFGIAWYMAKNPDLVHERQKTNYGHLIDPAIPIDYGELLARPISPAGHLPEAKGHWLLVQIAPGPACDDACRATAAKTAQLRLMLNKEITRVRRLLLVPGQADTQSLQALMQADPTLLVAGISDDLLNRLKSAVGQPLKEGTILLFDPFANLLMWYEPGFDPYGAQRDLQRLLRVSQIG
ncbi:hypothetical protein [Methylococcus sp. EFPC2]|uniref:hypothetical protein n=1 Tax=Methylococcus sp. EFPC2 TaxID=2812648 RepID=UPI0019689B28|nr:hypothetical protein [Methylococcus sp. EFPC2]QSA95885.1 hypothetical protein JWZ97_11610 [Methylococcus sp. EFPC2]